MSDTVTRTETDEIDRLRQRLEFTIGRIKPHYLYNVLSAIYYLCDSDPAQAQSAIGSFAEYLRCNLNVAEDQELVPFRTELDNIRHYLNLEKLRYGDRLQVDIHADANGFKVPPLAVQSLVENAVKHGIAAKEGGGTLYITSENLPDDSVRIRIRDDGVGFDTSVLNDQKVTFESVTNVRDRIRSECGGELTVESTPGKGTTATITLRPVSDS